MDMEWTEEQSALGLAVGGWLDRHATPEALTALESSEEGFDPEGLAELRSHGWLDPGSSAAGARLGEELLNLSVVLRELGGHAYPSPFFVSQVAAGTALRVWGGTAPLRRMAASVAAGSVRATLAVPSGGTAIGRLRSSPEGLSLHVGPTVIEWPQGAELLVCVGQFDGEELGAGEGAVSAGGPPGSPRLDRENLRMVLVPMAQVEKALVVSLPMDNERVATLEEHELTVDESAISAPLAKEDLDNLVLVIGLLRCSEMVGGARRVLEMTVDYVKKREQFGGPLAVLQAVQHKCADMQIELDGATLVLQEALWRAATSRPFVRQAVIALDVVGRSTEHVLLEAMQLHGGIGHTVDYPLQFFARRNKAQRLRLGSLATHSRRMRDDVAARPLGDPFATLLDGPA